MAGRAWEEGVPRNAYLGGLWAWHKRAGAPEQGALKAVISVSILTLPTTLSGQMPYTQPVTTAPVTWRCFGDTSSYHTHLQ